MKNQKVSDNSEGFPVKIFQPKSDVSYSLDVAAHLAGVPRRSILIYCRAGLVCPVFQTPHGMMLFTEEAIHKVRCMEHVRTTRVIDLALIKTLFDLFEEVDRLHSELRFLRKH